ncbi:hypothetical protein H4R19_000937, partial [Coemansia spiralis]
NSFMRGMGASLSRQPPDGRDRRSGTRSPRRRSRSRHRSGSRRPRHGYERDDKRRDYDYGRRDRSRTRRRYRSRSNSASSRHRRDRPRARERSSSRQRGRTAGGDVVPLHLRPNKRNMWDLAPPGFENIPCMEAKAMGRFPPPGQAAGSSNVASFNPSVLFEHTHRNENDRFRPSSRGEREFPSTAQRQARRLYVGNIPLGADEDAIVSFFNDLMVRLNIAPADELPVENIQINHDKNYAFVEFRTAEQATMGMGLDGVMFQSQKVKIRRPKDYIPPVGEPEPQPPVLNVPGVLASSIPDTPNKIYVGGLPMYLQEDQVVELLRAFGELRAFHLVRDNVTNASRGFAFCEYLDPNVTEAACQGLNGMELGDRHMIVQRANSGTRGGSGGGGGGGGQRGYSGPPPMMAQGAYEPPHLGPPVGQMPAVMPAGAAQATSIVQLLNMVTASDLADSAEYDDIMDDIRDECSNYGAVAELVIPRPRPDQPDAVVPGVGKIFVRFATNDEATAALNALAGRQFNGRTVIASYITQDDFDSGNF